MYKSMPGSSSQRGIWNSKGIRLTSVLADDAFAEKDIPADVEEDIEVFCDWAGTAAGQTFFEAAD